MHVVGARGAISFALPVGSRHLKSQVGHLYVEHWIISKV